MFDVHYLTLGPGGGKAHIWEINRNTEITGDLMQHAVGSYFVDGSVCDCQVFLKANNCVHVSINHRKLVGPRIPDPDIDRIVKDFKRRLSHCSEVIMPVGHTSFRKKPVERAEVLVQCASDNMELWSYYDKFLVRAIFSTPEKFDLTLRLLNDIILLDQGEILDF